MLNAVKHLARTVEQTRTMRARCFTAFSMTTVLCLLIRLAHAQAPNDNIENRRLLRAEETITSGTVGCTVQRSCVDERPPRPAIARGASTPSPGSTPEFGAWRPISPATRRTARLIPSTCCYRCQL